jgi:hypothetical protein
MGQLNDYFFLVVKALFVLGTLLYLVFAAVVVKQTTTMSKNVSDKFNPVLIAFAYLHFAFSVFLVILTFLIL